MLRLGNLRLLVVADLKERTRRYSFLVTMLGVLFFGYLVITGKYAVKFGACRTVYDAAWAGSLMAVCGSVMMAIVGFYLVRGAITRDRQTEVGQIIAATPMSKTRYLLSKVISNIAVLWFMIAVLAVVAFLTLLVKNETDTLDLYAFLSPFVMISLPVSIFVAAMAVLFDSVKWLRGSAGNIIYLFIAEICLVLGMLEIPVLDLGAVSFFTESVRAAAALAFPAEKISLLMGFIAFDPSAQAAATNIFAWNGINWTANMTSLRLLWVGVAGIVTLLAVPFFDRFDPARTKVKVSRKKKKPTLADDQSPTNQTTASLPYGDICPPEPKLSLLIMIRAELRLVLRSRHWFWYAMVAVLLAAQLVIPFALVRQYLLPAAMIWPLVIWSGMGTREHRYGIGPLLFSSPAPLQRQLPAIWLAGLMISLVAVGGMTVRATLGGEMQYAGALLVGAFFIPTAALFLGLVSGSKKLFEVVYLMVWYVGSIDHVAPLDILATTEPAVTVFKITLLILLMPLLLLATAMKRRHQIVS